MFAIRDFIISALVPVVVFTGQQAGARRCFGTTNLSSRTSGSFVSPGYPYNKYSNNENCAWRITAPPGQRVLIYFTSFQLEDSSSCIDDSVSIYDGANSNSRRLAKKCGSEIPAPIYSTEREIFVKFRSDESVTFSGFKAKYLSLSSSSACSSINSGDSTGVVFSPGFPWFYPNNRKCDWDVATPYGTTINLTFTIFDLQPRDSSSCSDYLRVTYASGYRSNMKLCGRYQAPFTMTSAGNERSLHIEFSSGFSNNSYKGFMAFYQKEVRPTTPPPYRLRSTQHPPPFASHGCAINSNNVLRVNDTSSIASPGYPGRVPSFTFFSCAWRISTTDKDYLELTFDDMSIPRCGNACTCGNVRVYEGNSANVRLLTFCAGKTSKVTSKGNVMSVKYNAYGSSDIFKATIRAKSFEPHFPANVVPLVIGVLLFGIIFAVIRCNKKIRIPSTGQAGSSHVYEAPLQPLPPSGTRFHRSILL